jgi:RNA polymerase sigma-70 factor (ECF subfamily)
MGHTAPSGSTLMRGDLADESEHLCRVLRELMPEEVEVGGLLALVLATDARRITRTDVAGKIVSLALQDRARWDREAIDEAMQILSEMRMDERPGPYVLQAAIALVHATAPTYDDTDWLRILDLYDELRCVWPTPVVELNRAVVISMVFGPAPALDDVDRLEKEGALSNYQYLFAIKADLLRQLGRSKEAAVADRRALELTANDAERAVLIARLDDSQ